MARGERAAGDVARPSPIRPKLTIPAIRAAKGASPLVMVTAYDAPTARLASEAGVDLLLVGDSVGTAVLGYESTVPVTLDDIVHHCRAVRRGAPDAHVVADLPFMSYQVSDEQAVTSAGRLLKEGGADSVKLEGGHRMAARVAAIDAAGIPVMGHVGLTPQTAGSLGGLKVQGRDVAGARAVLHDAGAIVAAGAYSIVVEVVPAELGRLITARVAVPTIGIGAGVECDGQVLVAPDLLGLTQGHVPRFVQPFADLATATREAFAAYARDVRDRTYPASRHTYAMKPEVLAALQDDDASPAP